MKRGIIIDCFCPICGIDSESVKHNLWSYPPGMDVLGVLWEKKFQKIIYCGSDFLQVVEEMNNKCNLEEFELLLGISKKIWLRRNTVVRGGEFIHLKLVAGSN